MPCLQAKGTYELITVKKTLLIKPKANGLTDAHGDGNISHNLHERGTVNFDVKLRSLFINEQ